MEGKAAVEVNLFGCGSNRVEVVQGEVVDDDVWGGQVCWRHLEEDLVAVVWQGGTVRIDFGGKWHCSEVLPLADSICRRSSCVTWYEM
jgi:hypothetical protein